jgi:3-keto-5-aminohexanoate cleavage enzyme
MGTLNLGSINMYDGVYSNCESDIYFYARKLKEKRIIPSLLCFDLSHFYMPARLERDGLLDSGYPPTYALIFDTPNSLPFSEENLDIFVSRLPKDAVWFLILHHAMGAKSFKAAIDRGGHVRVGYEDGPFLSNGSRAGNNTRLVEEAVRYAQACGRRIASPTVARSIMSIPQLNK